MSDYQQIKKITFIRELTPKALGDEQVYLSKEAQYSLLAQPKVNIDKLLAQAFKFFAKNKSSQEYKKGGYRFFCLLQEVGAKKVPRLFIAAKASDFIIKDYCFRCPEALLHYQSPLFLTNLLANF